MTGIASKEALCSLGQMYCEAYDGSGGISTLATVTVIIMDNGHVTVILADQPPARALSCSLS